MLNRRMKPLIVFVGIDGVGKTTQALNLTRTLRQNMIKCVYLRPRYLLVGLFPFPIKKWIYERAQITPQRIVRNEEKTKDNLQKKFILFKVPITIILLMYSCITYLISIRPLLDEHVVVCDRYFYDWFYNLWGDLSIAFMNLLPHPSLILLLDLPLDIAYSRMNHSDDTLVSPKYYSSLRSWYLLIINRLNGFAIDTSGSIQKTGALVLEKVLYALNSLLDIELI